MKSHYKKLGTYIRQVSTRNRDMKVTDLQGISINKEFMPSVANVIGTDLSVYRVVSRNQFAFNPMHVGRDEVLPINLLSNKDAVIVSPAYIVFEIKDMNILDPEYLMMWFRRPEFDREAWFTTDSSVRGGFSWDIFCNMDIPILDIVKQKEIIKEYHALINRIRINNNSISKFENLLQELYKNIFGEINCFFENLTENQSLEGNVKIKLGDFVDHSKQTISPIKYPEKFFYHYSIPSFDESKLPSFDKGDTILSNKFLVKNNSILFSKLNPNFSRVWNLLGEVEENSISSTEFLVLIPRKESYFGFIFCLLKSEAMIEYLTSMATGTSNSHQRIRPEDLFNIPMPIISEENINLFNEQTKSIINYIKLGSKPVDRINYPIKLALGSVKLPTGKNHEFEMQK